MLILTMALFSFIKGDHNAKQNRSAKQAWLAGYIKEAKSAGQAISLVYTKNTRTLAA